MDNRQREFERWFEQAKYDLKSAEDSLEDGNHEWACFQAQQSAEKALKAYLYLQGESLIDTHSIFRLLRMCSGYDQQFAAAKECKELDEYYIPTRYPNGLPDAVPHLFYTKEDAEKCVGYAKKIISLVERVTKK
jgi:HEPN domain-containing protein